MCSQCPSAYTCIYEQILSKNINGCLLQNAILIVNIISALCSLKMQFLFRSSTHYTNETNNLKYIPKMLENIIPSYRLQHIKYRKKNITEKKTQHRRRLKGMHAVCVMGFQKQRMVYRFPRICENYLPSFSQKKIYPTFNKGRFL